MAFRHAVSPLILLLSKSHPDSLGLRYLEEIIGRSKNPYYLTVAREIGDAIYLERGTKETYPRYRDQADQEARLDEVFQKFAKVPELWGPGAQKVRLTQFLRTAARVLTLRHASWQTHANEMVHVRKGCLTRVRDDIAADGSRIESSHKHLNHFHRAVASGLSMLVVILTNSFC